jgi:hypothetical protein
MFVTNASFGLNSFDAFEKLLVRLGLPDSNARTLAAILGMSRDQTLKYDEFEKLLSLGLHSSYLRLARVAQDRVDQVFLGGSCNPTTWRRDEAIPYLETHHVRFYNPQVADWNAELVILEALAKTHAELCLFVIDDQTRAIASMIEAAEFIAGEREVVVVIKDIPLDTCINNEKVAPNERRDLNRARAYLADIAQRHLPHGVFRNVTDACSHVVTLMHQKRDQREREAKRLAAHHQLSGSGTHSGPVSPNSPRHSQTITSTTAPTLLPSGSSSSLSGQHHGTPSHTHSGSGGHSSHPHHHHAHTIALTTAPPPSSSSSSSSFISSSSVMAMMGSPAVPSHATPPLPGDSPRATRTRSDSSEQQRPSSINTDGLRRPGSSHGNSLDGSFDGLPSDKPSTTTNVTSPTNASSSSNTGSVRGGRLPPLLPPVDGHRRRPSGGSTAGVSSVGRSWTIAAGDASLTTSQRNRSGSNNGASALGLPTTNGNKDKDNVADWEAEVTNSLRATIAGESNRSNGGRPGSSGGGNGITDANNTDGDTVARGESMEIIISPAKRGPLPTARSNTVALTAREQRTSSTGSRGSVTHLDVKDSNGRDSPARDIEAMSDILFPGRLPNGNSRRGRSTSSAAGGTSSKKKITDEAYFGSPPLTSITPSSPPLSPLLPLNGGNASPVSERPESTDGKTRSEFYYDRVMGEMMPSFKDLFDQMDAEKKGTISPVEIQAMLSKLHLVEGNSPSHCLICRSNWIKLL